MRDRIRRAEAAASGIETSLPELLGMREAAQGLRLAPVRGARAPVVGPHRSAYRGRGIDFDEVRAYQPGDDVRTIDWRVTARTGCLYSKVFHEERERPVWLLADLGASMRFGSRARFKSVAAARATALIAWVSLLEGDRVGAVVRSPTRAPQRALSSRSCAPWFATAGPFRTGRAPPWLPRCCASGLACEQAAGSSCCPTSTPWTRHWSVGWRKLRVVPS